MTTAVEPTTNPDEEWLPDHCPAWCDGVGAHAVPLAEGCGWYASQQHSSSGSGDCLSELTYAGRPVREWGGGWDMHAEQRPLGPNGGYWGPALIHIDVTESDAPARRRALLKLTSGEARTLARQLIALADRLDL